MSRGGHDALDLPQRIGRVKAAADLAALAGRTVKLVRAGREWKGLCPFHAERSPSFYVIPDKGFWHCFGCGAHGDVVDLVRRLEGGTFAEALARLEGELGLADPVPGRKPVLNVARDTTRMREREAEAQRRAEGARGTAWRIWEHARALDGADAASLYLAGRGIPGAVIAAAARADALRVAGRLRHSSGHEGPALVARVVDASGRFLAVQRTWLDPKGPKGKADVSPNKMALGPLRGGRVPLAGEAGDPRGLAEGVESALAAWALSGVASDAGLGGNMGSVELPFEIGQVVIFRDPGAAGLRLAQGAARRFLKEQRQVSIVTPEGESDANDVLLARGAA